MRFSLFGSKDEGLASAQVGARRVTSSFTLHPCRLIRRSRNTPASQSDRGIAPSPRLVSRYDAKEIRELMNDFISQQLGKEGVTAYTPYRFFTIVLEVGMILSNEPGYYREGAFGIRIENLIVVQEAPALPDGDDRAMLSFDTLTFAPIDRRLIQRDMLSAAERDWLNAYHLQVAKKIAPQLEGAARDWLIKATAPI